MYVVVSEAASPGARPEDADDKAHHSKDGKGYLNPWESYRDFAGWQMGLRLLWYVYPFSRGIFCGRKGE